MVMPPFRNPTDFIHAFTEGLRVCSEQSPNAAIAYFAMARLDPNALLSWATRASNLFADGRANGPRLWNACVGGQHHDPRLWHKTDYVKHYDLANRDENERDTIRLLMSVLMRLSRYEWTAIARIVEERSRA